MKINTAIAFSTIAAALLATSALAQFGPPGPPQTGPKLAQVKVFPAPGIFPTTESVTLLAPEPGAAIHYTLDGSLPTAASPLYDPLNVLFVTGIYDGEKGLKTQYTIRAVATEDGHINSDPLNYQIQINRRDRDSYVSEEILPGVRMVRDSDNDKMFLVKGSKKYALIDSGLGHGKLLAYLSQYTHGLPIEVIFTHNHGDHIGQADQFIAKSVEHIGALDQPGLVRLLKSRGVSDAQIAKNVQTVKTGDRIDLGDRALAIYDAPGHTPGSIVIFDEKTGNIFTGDSFGSNSPTIPDALWLQGTQTSLDGYMAVIKNVRAPLHGKIKHLMTGHNDRPLAGETYLDNLEAALQALMDKGEAALVPSYRPAGLKQVTIGDRLTDPDWIAINVNLQHFLPAPVDKISGLTHIGLDGATLDIPFTPATHDYQAHLGKGARTVTITAVSTSGRASLTVNGQPAKTAMPVAIPVTGDKTPVTIAATSPDGSQTTTYTVAVVP